MRALTTLSAAVLVAVCLACSSSSNAKEHNLSDNFCVEHDSGKLPGNPSAGGCDRQAVGAVAGCYHVDGKVVYARNEEAAATLLLECPSGPSEYRRLTPAPR